MGLYSEGLIIGRIFASEIWGTYFREGFFLGGGGGVAGGLLSGFYGINKILEIPDHPRFLEPCKIEQFFVNLKFELAGFCCTP